MGEFSHLHCHTQYSLLDGAARIKTLVERAAELELAGIAVTDHGNLFGVPEFYFKAKDAGLKPVIGCEFYLSPGSMNDRSDRTRYHQVLFARNEEGYRNLMRLSSLSYSEGYYYKPRIDREALRRHRAGLLATTCCLQGEVPQAILQRGEEAARPIFEAWLDLFGEDYYIEIQDHGIEDQKRCNAVLLRWSREYGVKLIATNDVHYVHQADAHAQDVLLCLQTGKDLQDPNRMRFENDQFFLKSADEMRTALSDLEPHTREEALRNTREVVEKCELELSTGRLLMPHYPIPAAFGTDMDAYLRHLVYERARSRYPEMPSEVVERLDFELEVIKTMGYAGYFLIVQDFTTAARELGVSVGPGRGSAAGSAVAYCLGITNIDPLAYDLLFERFLNPERVSMPDIDIDFDDRGRGRVIDYVVQKYGRESVCQIITFGTMGARSVIRDVARVLGIPLTEADRIAKLIPEGPRITLDVALNQVPELRGLLDHPDSNTRRLIEYARVLEGSARHTGVHAAGVIIAPGRVSDFVPTSLARAKSGGEDVVTTQYDGKWVESFGLLKMDFLGLKTLTVLSDALALIKENHGMSIDLDNLALDDPKTFELFQRGETVSIFQFESSGMREWMRKLKPTHIDDLIAMNALYRPGPMDHIPEYVARKHGRQEIRYPHPLLEDILRPTYGIPIYQEQVMQIAQVMGGYTLGRADLLRRAMSKKKQEEMDRQRASFVEGARRKGVDERTANDVFDLMDKFALYGFNKSHAAAYSVVAYQTAYLKANYPAEFMAAALTNEMTSTDRLAVILDDARHLNLDLLPPSVNRSQAYFTVEDGKIRFGLGAIKGVGLSAIEALVQCREHHGPFTSLFDLVRFLDLRTVNKKVLECLAKAGALDALGGHRAQQAEAVDLAVQYAQRAQIDRASGQSSLFSGVADSAEVMQPNLPSTDPWPRARVLKEERDLLGFYLSGHPLEAFAAEVKAFATASLGDVELFGETDEESSDPRFGRDRGPLHRFCGIVTDVQQRTTRSGKPIVFATLEDFRGQGELVCFSNTYERVAPHLTVDSVVLVKGEAEVRRGGVKIVAQDVLPMWKVREQLVKAVVVRVGIETGEAAPLLQLRELCEQNRGNVKLYFDVEDVELPAGLQRIRSRTCMVDPTPDLMQGIVRIFGRENVSVEGEP